jgi:hypothetical protein
MIFPFILKHWKLVLAGLLAGLLVVQTIRLLRAQVAAAEFKTELAVKRAEGVAEGARQQQAAQALLDAVRTKIAAAKLADAKRRATEAIARVQRLTELLADSKWQCLREPLPEEVLREYRQ